MQEFDKLGVSICVYLFYTNVVFDLERVFRETPVIELEQPEMKRKKKIKSKDVKAPYGSIFNLKYLGEVRGITFDTKAAADANVPPVNDEYFISNITEDKSKKHFRNEVMITLSLGSKNVNIMLFKDNMKIAGCRTEDEAVESVMILWEEYLSKLYPPNTEIKFVMDLIMKNRRFDFGFIVNREELNTWMNKLKKSKSTEIEIFSSKFKSESSRAVNIKTRVRRPKNISYDVLVYGGSVKGSVSAKLKPRGGSVRTQFSPHWQISKGNPFPRPEKYKIPKNTFLVFNSGQAIVSGRYYDIIKEHYYWFTDLINENQDAIKHSF